LQNINKILKKYYQNMTKSKKNIVIIGGGNGSAISINAVKNLPNLNLSAVVSTSDSNGSSGRLRKEFKTLPPGDVMRAVLAMSPHDYDLLKKIFYRNRFSNCGKLDQHDLGNLFLVWAEKYADDYLKAVRALEQAVDAVGKVYPNSLQRSDLVGKFTTGQIVKTEGKLDRPEKRLAGEIKEVWLEPFAKAYAGALKVIREADVIIMGPGTLYTSIVASILPAGIREAIGKSKAKLIYLCPNAYEKIGEQGPTSLSGLVKGLQNYLPRPIDLVIFDHQINLNNLQKKYYLKKKWGIFKDDREKIPEYKIVVKDLERAGGGMCPVKLGRVLKDFLK